MRHVLPDRSDELTHASKTSPADAFVRQVAEPAFDHVQPRTRRRDEVQLEARMPPQPGGDPRVFVSPVVVHDQMEIEMGRRLGVDLLEEPDELLVPMARHAVADDIAIKQAQCGEQGRRAVACVVMRQGPTAAFLHRKAWLGAVEGLDLAFLVDREHQGLVRRIEVEPDYVVELLDKLFVAAKLERPDAVGLEAVALPDTPYRGLAEALGGGHAPRAPLGRRRGRRVERGLDDGPHFAGGDPRETTGTRGILFQPRHSQGQKSFPPELHRGPRDAQGPSNVLIAHAIGCHLDNPGALHEPEGNPPAMRPGGQGRTLVGRQQDRSGSSHAPQNRGKQTYMSIYL